MTYLAFVSPGVLVRSVTQGARVALVLALLVCGTAHAGDSVGLVPSVADSPDVRRGSVPVVRYSVAYRGGHWTRAQRQRFADVVEATLDDPRGWSLAGAVRFQRGAIGAFTVTLASPSLVAAHGGCSSYWSCRSGRHVLINADRWFRATSVYPGQPRLQLYRQLVINHEVGHALGFGHAGCARRGRLAPVMMQQSKGLAGCRINPWPTASEQHAFAARRGVRARRTPPRLVPGSGMSYIKLGDERRSVTARMGDPQASRTTPTRRTDHYSLFALVIRYERGRVVRITSRNVLDRTPRGTFGVGVPYRVVRAIRGVRCSMRASGTGICAYGPRSRPTTLLFDDWRATRVVVEARRVKPGR